MSQSGPQWEKEMDWDRINTYIKTHGDPADRWLTQTRVSTVPLPRKDYTDELIKFVEDLPQLKTADGNLIPKVDYKLYDKRTLFVEAVVYEKYDLAELFLNMGADVNAHDSRDTTALYFSYYATVPNLKFIKLLLDRGANANETIRFGGMTTLLGAIQHSNTDVVELLLEYGADPNKGDKENNRPLHSSVTHCRNTDTAKLLLEYGADINGTNVVGTTALLMACLNVVRILQFGSKKIDFLLEYGADPFILNNNGENILNNQYLKDEVKDYVADKIHELHKLNVELELVAIAKGIEDDPLQELTDDVITYIKNKRLRMQYNPEITRLRMAEDIHYMYEKRMERNENKLMTHYLDDLNQYGSGKRSSKRSGNSSSKRKSKHKRSRRRKYSMKKKYGGVGKRKRSDSNEPSEPNSEEMKNALRRQAAIRLQRITRGRQLRQKRKLTRKNIGKRETIYTPHKKCYRDLTWKEKLEIIRRYYELTKQLKDNDDMAKYLFPLYFPCEKHYTSIPIPISFQNLQQQIDDDDDDDNLLLADEPPLSSSSSEFTEYDLDLPVFGQMEPDDSSSEPYAENLLQHIALEQINNDD